MRYLAIVLVIQLSLTSLAQRGPTPVFTQKARKIEIIQKQQLSGNVQAALIASVAGIEAGRVDEVYFKIGDKVTKDQVLAKLDNRRIQHDSDLIHAQVKEIAASIAKLEGELKIQNEEIVAFQNATAKMAGSVSDKVVREARLAVVRSQGNIAELTASQEVLKTRLEKLKTSLGDTVIKAPFDGVILERSIQTGAWLQIGGEVAKLQSYDCEAVLKIPEQIAFENFKSEGISLYTGNPATPLKIDEMRLLPQVDTESGNYKIIATIKDGKDLIPGAAIRAEVPTGKKQLHLLVPTNAVMRNGAGYFVYKVVAGQEGTNAMPVSVQVLFRHEHETAVICLAIQEGDAIIVEGNERLFPMMPVAAKPLE